jgi:hypothetical protein
MIIVFLRYKPKLGNDIYSRLKSIELKTYCEILNVRSLSSRDLSLFPKQPRLEGYYAA